MAIERAKAPLRISFAGGGTDVPPFTDTDGGCVLSATIARYAYATLTTRADGQITVDSADLGQSLRLSGPGDIRYDGTLDLVKAALVRFSPRQGYSLRIHSDAPPGSGLGASSAMVVALVGLLGDATTATSYDIAALAAQIERGDMAIPGGFQDHYAAAFGGFNYIEFQGPHVIVHPLRLPAALMNELHYNLLLCYSGATRESGGILRDQIQRYGTPASIRALRSIKRTTTQMRDALLRHRLDDFGALLGEEWALKKELSGLISNPRLDAIYERAIAAGAIGGKVTGAGGGGYMLLFCPPDHQPMVRAALLDVGATLVDFSFEPAGLQTWRAAGT